MREVNTKGNSIEATAVTVKVRFTGDLRALLGEGDFTISLPSGSTVKDIFTLLCTRYGEPFTCRVFSNRGTLQHTIVVFVNGRNIEELGGLGAALIDSDVEIIMLPMIEGG